MIFSAIVSNMSVTPALLLTFDCFSKFELFPTYESCRACFCCCSRSSQGTDDADAAGNKERDINGQASNASGDPLKMTTKSNGSAADIAGGGIANGSSSRGERKQMESDEEFGVSPGRVCQDDVVGNGTAVDSGGVITTAPDAVSSERAMTTWGQTERNSAMSSQRDKVDENVGDGTSTGNGRHIVTEKRTMWFYITYWVTKYSWLTLLVVAGITVPFAMHFMIMVS